jgi:hypothetical protein
MPLLHPDDRLALLRLSTIGEEGHSDMLFHLAEVIMAAVADQRRVIASLERSIQEGTLSRDGIRLDFCAKRLSHAAWMK